MGAEETPGGRSGAPGPSRNPRLPPAAARSVRRPSSEDASPGAGPEAAKTAGRPGAGRRALCCGLRWWGAAGGGGGPGPGACGWEALWGAGARAAAGAMAEGGGGARRRAPALLEAARARYESLHISDDVFGESGPDSGGNPFYSTSAASRSSSAASSDDEPERPGPPRAPAAPPPPRTADAQKLEEDEAGAGWSATLRDRPPPRFEDTGGKEPLAGRGVAWYPDPGWGTRVLGREDSRDSVGRLPIATVRFRKQMRLWERGLKSARINLRVGAAASSWVERMWQRPGPALCHWHGRTWREPSVTCWECPRSCTPSQSHLWGRPLGVGQS